MDSHRYIEKARRDLESGHHLLHGGYPDFAGRNAYLAAFHAALALIVSRTDKRPKMQGGTHAEFARLARDEPRIAQRFVAFLSRSYEMKTIADYGDARPVTADDAAPALDIAEEFVDLIAGLLPPEAC